MPTVEQPPLIPVPGHSTAAEAGRDVAANIAENVDDYVNPLDSQPRWYVSALASTLRGGAILGSTAFGLWYAPTRTVRLDCYKYLKRPAQTAVDKTQKLSVSVWEPPRAVGAGAGTGSKADGGRRHSRSRPAIIDFHGGGFFMGTPTDDGVWASSLARDLGAVVLSVSYRKAPAVPFPGPVEDCADAILQIVTRASEFGIDPARVVVSGFSSGGNLALTSWLVLNEPSRWGYSIDASVAVPPIAGLVLFYPVLDYTISRPRKRLTCARPDLTLPKFMTDVIDAGYVYPPRGRDGRADVRLSPGLMEDALLARLPEVHLVLCEWDMLLAENLAFSERLRAAGKLAAVKVVAGERHAWDKPPPWTPKKSATREYQDAIARIGKWINITETAE